MSLGAKARAVLAEFQKASLKVVVPGRVVEHETEFLSRLNRALENGAEERRAQLLHASFIENPGMKKQREWRREFGRLGFKALYGAKTVWSDRPENPLLLWRVAERWDAGMSWATDARWCTSVPVNLGRTDQGPLWCAVVPPDAVLGVNWYLNVVENRVKPLWRLVDSEQFGLVTVGVQDAAEVFVDPSKLVEAGRLGVGQVFEAYRFDSIDSITEREMGLRNSVFRHADAIWQVPDNRSRQF